MATETTGVAGNNVGGCFFRFNVFLIAANDIRPELAGVPVAWRFNDGNVVDDGVVMFSMVVLDFAPKICPTPPPAVPDPVATEIL